MNHPDMETTMDVKLKARTAVEARREIHRRWPTQDVNYTGYNKQGEAVIMSLVRGATRGNVATVRRNDESKPVTFYAQFK